MKALVLLALFVACAQALHATRPLVTPNNLPSKKIKAQRAQAKFCRSIKEQDKCSKSSCLYCVGKAKELPTGCYSALESLLMPKSKHMSPIRSTTLLFIFRHPVRTQRGSQCVGGYCFAKFRLLTPAPPCTAVIE